jgi:uncharacterized protein (DUF608 family)
MRGISWTPPATLAFNLVAHAAGTHFTPATGLDPAHRYWGTMALSTTAKKASATAQWRDLAKLWADFAGDSDLSVADATGASETGATWNSALAVPLRVEPGKSASATFLLAWHFPNHYYQGAPGVRIGNMYTNWFKDAEAVAQYLAQNFERLHAETKAYHDAIYDTSLPYYLSDQPNTYDCSVHGPNPFIGSLYLAALRAAEEMARVCGGDDFAKTCRTIFERGQKNFDDLMWNDEFGYYVQTYDEKKVKGMQFGWGCHADQTMGQWWADVVNLGYVLPKERAQAAVSSTFKHNWRTNFRGHKQVPRVYALDDDKGLLICTWPNGRRPDPVTLYSDEIWTGIEYEVAGELIYQGLVKEGLTIVLGCRDRYDGISRPNTCCNVGNPFDEVECGTNYARAMSSWSVLLALQGYIHNGPAGILGFKPRYTPEKHRSFFTAAEGWGVLDQKRGGRQQTDTLEVRYGQLTLKELIFELPEGAADPKATLTLAGKAIEAKLTQTGSEVRLALPERVRVASGEVVKIVFTW